MKSLWEDNEKNLKQKQKGNFIPDTQMEVLLYRTKQKYFSILKLKETIVEFTSLYTKILEYNRKFFDCITKLFSFTSIFNDLDTSIKKHEGEEYNEVVKDFGNLNLRNFQVCERVSSQIKTILDRLSEYEVPYNDIPYMKKEKDEAYKKYEYYSSKIKDLRSKEKHKESLSFQERLERNEIKYVESHSKYMSKSYKVYNFLEKIGKEYYKKVGFILKETFKIQKELYNEVSFNYNEVFDILDKITSSENRIYDRITENILYNPMIFDDENEKELEKFEFRKNKTDFQSGFKEKSSDDLIRIEGFCFNDKEKVSVINRINSQNFMIRSGNSKK